MSGGQRLADAAGLADAVRNLADAVLAHGPEPGPLAVVGIRRRGDIIARRLGGELEARGQAVDAGTLDITFYRDDLDRIGPQPVVKGTEVAFDVNDRRVVLVDDVLFTGRTARAALDLLFDLGRPARIELAVLVDRGGREVPIAATHVAHTLQVGADLVVAVRVQEIDGADEIVLRPTGGAHA